MIPRSPVVLVIAVLVSACAGKAPASRTTVTAAPMTTAPASVTTPSEPACALGVDGTLVVFEETPEGARLYLLTSPGKREELRARARDLATNGERAAHGLAIVKLPSARLDEDDIDEGAVLDFTPLAMKDRDPLRVRVYERALALNDECRWTLIERHIVRR